MKARTKVVKPSGILRKAASIINSDLKSTYRDGACDAIDRADRFFHRGSEVLRFHMSETAQKAQQYFDSLFKPGQHNDRMDQKDRTYWFGEREYVWAADTSKETQEHRIIALLMTADMAESVGE